MFLLPPTVITSAISSAITGPLLGPFNSAPQNLLVEAEFVYGSSGTSVDAYVQTSIDDGLSWIDIINFHFGTSSANSVANLSSLTPVTTLYTPGSGSLSSNTCNDGILGRRFQVLYKSSGTYAGSTTLTIHVTKSHLFE